MKTILLLSILLFSGCAHFPRQTHSMEEVTIAKLDTDKSITVATAKLAQNRTGRGLGFWALRDQAITPDQAKRIVTAYEQWIDSVESSFDIWHYTWAITNFARSNGPEVSAIMDSVKEDAVARGLALDKSYAVKHLTDSVIYRGWYHGGGWLAARKHLVVPGDKRFIQSEQEFFDKRRNRVK